MTYRIARNGETFGPYSLLEVQRYLAAGNITPTDLVQGDTMQEWLPVADLFPTTPTHAAPLPGGLPRLFPDPPDLPWWIALILGIFTLGAFFVLWDVIESAWLRRVERSSLALGFYIAAAVFYLLKLPDVWRCLVYNMFDGPAVDPHFGFLFLTGLVIAIAARFVFRNELLRHFNGPEPIGLRLNWFLTLIFSGLYFQYHFNRINQLKRTLRISVPAA